AAAACGASPTIHGDPTGTTFVDADQTWGRGNHVIVGSLQFSGRVRLRIEAGATVCFQGYSYEIGLNDSSAIEIAGTMAEPVRIHPAGNGRLRIENYTNRPPDSPVHSNIVNARFAAVAIEGYSYDIDATYFSDCVLMLEGESSIRRSTLDHCETTVIAHDDTQGEYEASFLNSFPAVQVMGLGGDIWFHGCEFSGFPMPVTSFAAGIRIEQSNFGGSAGLDCASRADSVQAMDNYWGHADGPTRGDVFRGARVTGPVKTDPFLVRPRAAGRSGGDETHGAIRRSGAECEEAPC
ncbi:MAG: hypothetical protein FD129_2961, partial [bacterium]